MTPFLRSWLNHRRNELVATVRATGSTIARRVVGGGCWGGNSCLVYRPRIFLVFDSRVIKD